MSDQPRRRLLDRFNSPPTVIGEQSLFVGDLTTPGSLVLCGTVRGDGKVDGTLSIARAAHWEGDVHAQAAVIAGKVTGNLVVHEKLEIGATAVLRGSVTAGSVAVARGAVIDGDIRVMSGAPILQFDEKRAATIP
ncbi:MAG: polymer-forming cytoskeletal protein [Pseudomonadota bacterium]